MSVPTRLKFARILYMEDGTGSPSLVVNTLKEHGCQVDLAPNGKAGLTMHEKIQYDLILMDSHLPGMDEKSVLRAMSEQGPLPPAILLARMGEEKKAVDAVKLGAKDYVIRDSDGGYLQLLPLVIKQVLKKRRIAEEKRHALEKFSESEQRFRKIFHQLQSIMEGTGSAIGENFFRSLVSHLASALNVKFAIVGELANREGNKIRTLAFWKDNRVVENFVYNPADTPCERLLNQKECLYVENVRNGFPPNPFAVEMNVETYLGIPLFDSTGKALGVLAVLHDQALADPDNAKSIVTTFAARAQAELERRHIEDELLKYRHHLEELVQKRTMELRATHEQLVHAEKLSAVGKLVASIAHEFNNPIYGIRNVLEQIAEGVPMDPTYQNMASLAVRECNRITNLIKKLQDFHRPSPGITAPLDIHGAIDDMALLIRKKLKEKNIKLEKHYAANMPKIDAVADQIKQVILNILQNAEEAMPKEGGTITITTQVRKDSIKILFRDTGSGISPENEKLIFEPFFTTKSAVKGTGLGLFVSYGIIETHGGDLRVDSQPGQGTTFTVTLPVKP